MAKVSAAVLAAAEAAAKTQTATPDKLALIAKKMREVRDTTKEVQDLSARLGEVQAALLRLRTQELPELFKQAHMTAFALAPEGNLPGYEAELSTYFSASKPKDAEKAAKVIEHVAKVWKMPDLVKNEFTVLYGKGDAKKAAALTKLLKQNKIDYSNEVSVHLETLKAEIRRRFDAGKPPSPAELATLNVTVGEVVKIKQQEK